MAKTSKLRRAPKLCPSCGGTSMTVCPRCSGTGATACPRCGQIFGDRQFYADGEGAMESQVEIVNYYHRMATYRVIGSYAVSSVFAIIGGILILFAPDSRVWAANIVAGTFVILAAG